MYISAAKNCGWKYHNFLLRYIHPQATNILSPPQGKHLKNIPDQGSADYGEVDSDPDINCLASYHNWQYNNVTNQC